jgi:hypothetical protein
MQHALASSSPGQARSTGGSMVGRAGFLAARVSLVFLPLLGACNTEQAPALLKLELPPVSLSRDPVLAAVRITDADGKKSLGTKEYDFSVNPPALATVDRRGNVICQKSGDGSVEVSVGGVKAASPLRCRLVERIEAPAVGRVELGAGPFVPAVRVLGKGGAELADVAPTLTSKATAVVFAKENQLVPKSVGSAVIVARAGQAFVEFPVDVVRRVTVEALPLDANRKINFSLDTGKYELTVKLPVDKRLKADWRGAPYCDYSATGREHVSTCVLRTKGGVVFDNPAYLARGDQTVSTEGVTLFEVP